jgi:hypothetical protein
MNWMKRNAKTTWTIMLFCLFLIPGIGVGALLGLIGYIPAHMISKAHEDD